MSISKSFDWFGAPYSPPSREPAREGSSGAVVGIGWRASAMPHRGEEGRFEYECPPGGEPAAAWGIGPYTDDSSVCTAAVHDGRITLAEGGRVTIELREGADHFEGGSRNGVVTRAFGRWPGSFVVVAPEPRLAGTTPSYLRRPPTDRDRDGVPDADDRCPDEAENRNGYEDQDGCADDPDRDGDGVADSHDGCQESPEDADGFEDADGCPEPDNDRDEVADAADACPGEAEDRDGFQDTDGCPDLDNDADSVPDAADQCPQVAGPDRADGCPVTFARVEVTSSGVRLHPRFRRRTVDPDGQAALEETLTFLNLTRNRGRRFEVGGHFDGRRHRGRRDERRTLAQAEAVREWLCAHGVDASRLVARGYGSQYPLSLERPATGDARFRIELRALDPAGR